MFAFKLPRFLHKASFTAMLDLPYKFVVTRKIKMPLPSKGFLKVNTCFK